MLSLPCDLSFFGMSDSGFAKITAILTGLILTLWLAFAAPYGDDFMYARTVPDTCEADFWDAGGHTITSFSDAFGSLAPHWRHVNARGSNLLMLMLSPLPRWVGAILLGCAAAGWIYLCFVAASQLAGKPIRKWVMAIAALALWIWFPWADELVSMDCFVNYVVPSLAATAFAVLLMRCYSNRLSQGAYIGACAVAVVAGLMHEGFALPLVAGALATLFFHSDRRRLALPIVVILLISTLLCVFAPSTLARLGRHEAHPQDALFALLHLRPLYLVVLLLLWGLLTHRLGFVRHVRLSVLFWSVIAFVAICEAVVLGGRGRVLWPACLAMYVLAIAMCELTVLPGRILKYLLVAAFFLNVAYGVVLVCVQYRFAVVQWDVLNRLDANPLSRIDIQMPESRTAEHILRYMPRRYTQDCRSAKMIGTGRYGMEWDRVPLFTDKRWGDGGFDTWPKVTPDSTLRGSGTLYYSRNSYSPGDVLSGGVRILDRCYSVTATGDTLYRYDIVF